MWGSVARLRLDLSGRADVALEPLQPICTMVLRCLHVACPLRFRNGPCLDDLGRPERPSASAAKATLDRLEATAGVLCRVPVANGGLSFPLRTVWNVPISERLNSRSSFSTPLVRIALSPLQLEGGLAPLVTRWAHADAVKALRESLPSQPDERA